MTLFDWIAITSPWIALLLLIQWDASRGPTAKSKAVTPASREVSPIALERDAQDKKGAYDDEEQPLRSDQNSLSSDFADLIKTIKEEGAAYRREEQQEDKGKKIREWITIVLIFVTFAAVCWQVHEMIKVYEPIREQAEAAQKSAEAASRQADAAKSQAEAMTRQAAMSAKEIVAANRAWLGPLTASMNSVQKDKGLEGIVQYQNTGKEPAIDLLPIIQTKTYSSDDWDNGTAAKDIVTLADACLALSDANLSHGLQVVYPNIGFSSYQLHFDTNQGPDNVRIVIDDDMTAGKKIFKIQGCFTYRSIDSVHHSAFCYYYRANFTNLPNLNICNVGNAAD